MKNSKSDIYEILKTLQLPQGTHKEFIKEVIEKESG